MKKVDFKAVATKAGGHVAGAALTTQLNKFKFMQDLAAKGGPAKGLVTAAIGYIGIPIIAAKLKLSGKKTKGDLIEGMGEGMGIVGIMQAVNAYKPGLLPAIKGVEGLGMMTEEGSYDVSGYENNPIRVGNTGDYTADDNNSSTVRY